ncbi:MAG: SDR family oxidoreductase [Verrucomicrobia bacterium]|nr:SDR family oxidoreductase [Verrucomicrobiota bacterium]
MNLGLKGKVALVTGGAAGIGAAVVRLFAAEGAAVVIVDKNKAAAIGLAAELKRRKMKALAIAADLTREADCRNAVSKAHRAFGRLDIVVNNAGVNDSVPLEATPHDFLASLQRNLFHVFAITHFAAPHLKRAKGAVVNVSSKVADTGQGKTSGYAAAKGGVNALTREWAIALAPDGVRVNCVVPAECATPQYERWFNSLPDPAAARAAIAQLVPLGRRLTTPEEIAAAIVFLASPRSGHTTGQLLHVDGGYTHLDRAATHGHVKWG